MEDLVDRHVRTQIDWYQSRKARYRKAFRVTTSAVIVSSAMLPILTAVEFPGSKISVSIISVLIAVLTGLGAAYKWDRVWQSFTVAQSQLENSLAEWEMEMAALTAGAAGNVEAGWALTRVLLGQARLVVDSEIDAYFRMVTQEAGAGGINVHDRISGKE